MKTTDLIPTNNFIIEIGNYKMKMVGPGVPDWSDEGKYIMIWQKQNDGKLEIRV
ncbi:MAG: hypothetical protein ACUVRG_07650 [Ignavibacterium sp.]|uniref:hypothetical protein n=1 Tax=Ignavibacterium sp. TaxID=2651167 RepID=UPI004049748E